MAERHKGFAERYYDREVKAADFDSFLAEWQGSKSLQGRMTEAQWAGLSPDDLATIKADRSKLGAVLMPYLSAINQAKKGLQPNAGVLPMPTPARTDALDHTEKTERKRGKRPPRAIEVREGDRIDRFGGKGEPGRRFARTLIDMADDTQWVSDKAHRIAVSLTRWFFVGKKDLITHRVANSTIIRQFGRQNLSLTTLKRCLQELHDAGWIRISFVEVEGHPRRFITLLWREEGFTHPKRLLDRPRRIKDRVHE